ncbi:aspartate kinase [Ilyobacter polytropus]|uniref:Aspartokinase n=1 Tax=Ilyobacter polytropus (strain ATCC 51220 / DSM 2926 / LMG 16218 / CuHBu1) TaxID=572544 RepID=E3H8F8_ILYPC|nr:aspartate kinase [Ilyobacter polytropus]ADO82725.1 aspartate kinase [Ilyobacter polytropus DSM 2926]
MGIKVAKFGGSSVANASQMMKVFNIVKKDPKRKFVITSAPGKRNKEDSKITDLLYLCRQHVQKSVPFDQVFEIISNRYEEIVRDLNLDFNIKPYLIEIKENISKGANTDYVASRGEYLNGLILSQLLGFKFLDPKDMIYFNQNNNLDVEKTYKTIRETLIGVENAVIPGFYGSSFDGEIKTFSRGGSDVTGAIIAKAVNAEVYENWTDVSGFLMADPRIVNNPKPIEKITYKELRELSYMGANVLHDEAVFPVREAGIPINIRNTNDPDHKGTIIVEDYSDNLKVGKITGIAGTKNFTVLAIHKDLMNGQIGFIRKILSILEKYEISVEHLPSGIDTLSIVIQDCKVKGKLDKAIEEINQECEPNSINVFSNMAIIATVGYGIAEIPGMSAKVFAALAKENINIRMIDQGSSEINIIIGVESDDLGNAINAIYYAFENGN